MGQTTPDNLNKDWKAYTLDPATRYPNLNKNVVMPLQTVSLFDTDNPKTLERLRRNSQDVVAEVPKKRKKGRFLKFYFCIYIIYLNLGFFAFVRRIVRFRRRR